MTTPPDQIVDELGAVWCRKHPGAQPPDPEAGNLGTVAQYRLLGPKGQDQTGVEWLPYAIPAHLRFVPMSAAELIAIWQAYEAEAARLRLLGEAEAAIAAAEHGAKFLGIAREIEPSLGTLADMAPHYGVGGTA